MLGFCEDDSFANKLDSLETFPVLSAIYPIESSGGSLIMLFTIISPLIASFVSDELCFEGPTNLVCPNTNYRTFASSVSLSSADNWVSKVIHLNRIST